MALMERMFAKDDLVRPVYSSIEQSSLNLSSITNSPTPRTIAEYLRRRRQGTRHQCIDCGNSYGTPIGLSTHKQLYCPARHRPKKTFQCERCRKFYTSKDSLTKHIKTHTLPYKCTSCRRAFARSSLLQRHVRTHTGEKPFCPTRHRPKKTVQCECCRKFYTSKDCLTKHIRTHTLPYKCTSCGKAFSRPSLLQVHVRTHTGEKPFSCLTCKKAFTSISTLNRHLQTHLKFKKYPCLSCSKTFSTKFLLTRHSDGRCSGAPNLLHTEK